jgi:hypothetical protein
MAHDVQVEELIAAYLAADLSAEERTAVERRLAEDAGFKAQLNDLRSLLTVLRQGERPVTPVMLAELKERIALFLSQQAETIPVAQLIAAGAVNDLDENERRAVEKLLNDNPKARKELESLKALNAFLEIGRAQVSAKATRSLAERLSAKIPVAALAPALPQADETVSLQLQNPPVQAAQPQAASGAPTVRIYAARENPWRARAAAAAAAIALATGAFFVVQSLNNSNSVVKQDIQPAPGRDLPPKIVDHHDPAPQEQDFPNQPDVQKREQVAENGVGQSPRFVAPAPKNDIKAPDRVIRTPDRELPPTPPSNRNSEGSPSNQNIDEPKTQQAPSDFDKLKGPTPENPNPLHLDDGTDIVRKPVEHPPTPPSGFAPPTPTPPPPSVADQNTKPDKPEPVLGALVAVNVADGNVQATMPDNVQTSVHINQQLPSGTTLTTDIARADFALPGDGRLQVHRKSSMKVTLANLDTTVELLAGEFHYKAPPGGSLTVNARNIQVSKANGSVVVTLHNDGTVVTNVLANNNAVTVTQKHSKKQVSVPSGKNLVIKVDDSTTEGNADPNSTEQDLPDSPDVLAPTNKRDSENPKAKGKSAKSEPAKKTPKPSHKSKSNSSEE